MRKTWLLILLIALCGLHAVCAGNGLAERADEALPVSPSAMEENTGIFPMLERDGVRLQLVVSRERHFAAPVYSLVFSCPDDDEARYSFTDITLNEGIRLPDPEFRGERDEVSVQNLDLGPLFAQGILSVEEPLRVRCSVHREGKDGAYWEESCEAQVPAGFRPGFIFLPCMGGRAGAQELLDDGRVRVTLLGLGKAADADTSKLSLLLRVENLSDETIPFKLTGLSVNGVFFKDDGKFSFIPGLYSLAPGTYCYPWIDLDTGILKDSGITGISSVSLMLLSSERENTAAYGYTGGRFYPVVLSDSVPGDSVRIDAVPQDIPLLFENAWIRMYVIDCTQREYSWDEGYEAFTWRLLIENLTDTNLSLETSTWSLDSAPFLYGDVGAGQRSYAMCYFDHIPNDESPQAFLRFDGYTAGGGQLLFQVTDGILLPVD